MKGSRTAITLSTCCPCRARLKVGLVPQRLDARTSTTGCSYLNDWMLVPQRLDARTSTTGCSHLNDWMLVPQLLDARTSTTGCPAAHMHHASCLGQGYSCRVQLYSASTGLIPFCQQRVDPIRPGVYPYSGKSNPHQEQFELSLTSRSGSSHAGGAFFWSSSWIEIS